MRKKEVGFTLLETLVVISLISVLVALLLPALASARATARLVPCQANMRQIHAASQMYAIDFKDFVLGSVQFETHFSPGGNPSQTPTWHTSFHRPWYQAPAPIVTSIRLGYLPRDKQIAWCPDRTADQFSGEYFHLLDIDDPFWGYIGTSYGVNGDRWDSAGTNPANETEKGYWQYNFGGAIHPVEWSTYQKAFYMTETAGAIKVQFPIHLDPSKEDRAARHQLKLNTLGTDGHVKAIAWEEIFKLVDSDDREFNWGE